MAAQTEELQGSLGWEQIPTKEQVEPGERQSLPRKARLHLLSGGILAGGVLLVALLAPWLAPYASNVLNPDAMLLPPSFLHPFGTDAFGRDLFSRVVYGSRLALELSFLSALIAALPGILLGLLAGYHRGWIDNVLSRMVDAWLALPGLLLALLIIARTGPSLEGAILALGLTGIPGYFRLVRSSTISLANQPYVEASRALGAGGGRLIFQHILPNLFSQIIVLTTLRLGTFLLAGSSLSFIGLGAKAPAPEWGSLLAEGRDYYDIAWWMFAFPMLAMTLTVLGFNLLGDGLRDRWARRA
jgi:peptide/nickel transport system permease protein